MLTFESSGSFSRTDRFLMNLSKGDMFQTLEQAAREGVAALASATPKDSSLTANSWRYEIKKTKSSASITWLNTHTINGVPLVVMLQYGHGTGTGGYVQGRDFINPAIKPVFDKIADNVWKAVTSA